MVVTPWGDSDSLRGRQLQPVRGAPAAEVERSQRQRLFAAMVACVAAKGFSHTAVADLVEISGVSSRTFYDLFGDKDRCLREAVEAIVQLASPHIPGADPNGQLETEIGLHYRAFAEAVASQPAAAKLCLIEAFAGGMHAIEPVERATKTYEKALLELLERYPGRKGMPHALVAARLGGVLEVVRARLREGRESELAGLEEDIVGMFVAERPPPERLRVRARSKKSGPEALEAPSHSERAIRAFASLVAEHGYHGTKVDDVVRVAGMSARTFYANFRGKEDLMGAAIDSACAQAVAAVLPAFSRHSEWPDGVRGGFGALLSFMASRPALTQLVTVEVYAAGGELIERRNAGVAPLAALIENNTADWQLMPPVVYEVIAGGIWHTLRETVKAAGAGALPGSAPLLTYLTLSPFIGAQPACEYANGDGGRGAGHASRLGSGRSVPLRTPMRISIFRALDLIESRTMSSAEVAEEVGEDVAVVSEYLGTLASVGAIEEIRDEGKALRYRASGTAHNKARMVSTEQMSRWSEQERSELSQRIWEVVDGEIESAIGRGIFDQRPDKCIARTPLRIDEAGWRELMELHDRTLFASFEIQARSNRRMAENGEEEAIVARSIQIAYEFGEETDDDEGQE